MWLHVGAANQCLCRDAKAYMFAIAGSQIRYHAICKVNDVSRARKSGSDNHHTRVSGALCRRDGTDDGSRLSCSNAGPVSVHALSLCSEDAHHVEGAMTGKRACG